MRESRTLRAMWRALETTHGSDTEALSTETESKQSRPNLRSIGASPRPYRGHLKLTATPLTGCSLGLFSNRNGMLICGK